MTKEEINKLIIQACERTWNERTCKEIRQALEQQPNRDKDPCETCGYVEGSPFCLQYCPYDAERKKEQEPCERFEWGINGKVYKITKAKDGKEICQQVCDDAISREAVIEILTKYNLEMSKIAEDVNELPPVTPQQKYGKWIRIDKDKCKCDQCEVISFIAMYPNGDANYCPNCGHRMVEPQESEE